jgi:hypothetical protein
VADYTDGLGWAKLDTTAACHLADCMDMFQGRAASKRRKMLLFCYSKLNGAKIPFFRLGRGAIAKACGVSDEVAKKFIEFCCDNEIFVEFEETEKGLTPKRTFWWIFEGVGLQRTTPRVKTPTSRPNHMGQKHRSKNHHQTQIYQSREESSKSDLSSPASYVSTDATTEAGQMTTEAHYLRTEDVQPREDAIEVPQAEFDAQEEIFRQGIQEALDNIEQSKARSIDWEWHLYRESHKPVAGERK